MRFDLNETGLARIFRYWQIFVLDYFWSVNRPLKSSDVWRHLDRSDIPAGPHSLRPVSRSSVINFLNSLVDEKIVVYTEETGKGGYHRVYSLAPPSRTKEDFTHYLYTRFYDALNDFLEE